MRSLIYDLNGNYVIFKMLETFDKLKMKFMIPLIEESVFHINYYFHSSITWDNKFMDAKLFIKLFSNILNNKLQKS